MDDASEGYQAEAYPSPIRRAWRMTRVFAGPGMLVILLLCAFFGSFHPLEGASEALNATAPNSLRLCISSSSTQKMSQQTFLVIPHSFQEHALFQTALPKVENARVEIRRSSHGSFYGWLGIVALAALLTLFYSIPQLIKLFRPNPALARDDA